MSKKLSLLVEGWRFLPHSYAIVNQWQLLALAQRGDVGLKVRDTFWPFTGWQSMRGVFRAKDEKLLEALPRAREDEEFDVTYRIGFPYDFRLAPHGRTAVFLTSEYGVFGPEYFHETPDFARLKDNPDFLLITPSHWSARALRSLGLNDTQIAVVPHGVEPSVFRPDAERRLAARRHFGLNGLVFFSNGAVTPNKGIDLLLRAFAVIAAERPHARLMLKGLDSLYNSRNSLNGILADMNAAGRNLILDRVLFVGAAIGMEEMAALYQAADVYVSPYRAEGFNLPVLEAAASGLAVICTAGGPTDDFVTPDFARTIASRLEAVAYRGGTGHQLLPEFDHLVSLMREAAGNGEWRARAQAAGPLHVHTHYNWDMAVEQLLGVVGGDG